MAGPQHWDPSLFGGAAEYYEQGRLPYAEGLVDAFREALGADGSGRLLDVGCGPGSIMLRLADVYQEVIGIDPDPGMISAARRLSRKRGLANSRFVRATAEDLPLGLGEFDAIVFGSSFHWMDRERVARSVRSMLRPGGAVVQVDTARNDGVPAALPYPTPPREQIRQLVHRYLGEERRAGRTVGFVSPTNEEDVWRAAGFTGSGVVPVPDDRILTRSIADITAGTLSMSNSAPHLFGEQLPVFLGELRELLRATSPTGRFSVPLTDNELHIWRPTS